MKFEKLVELNNKNKEKTKEDKKLMLEYFDITMHELNEYRASIKNENLILENKVQNHIILIHHIKDLLIFFENGNFISNISFLRNNMKYIETYPLSIYLYRDILNVLQHKNLNIDLFEINYVDDLDKYISKIILLGGKILFNDRDRLIFVNKNNNYYLISDCKIEPPGTFNFSYGMFKKCIINNIVFKDMVSLQGLFNGCTNLETVIFKNIDTSRIVNMAEMFRNCDNLRSVNIEKLNTHLVKDFTGMFFGCKSLKNIDLSNFDTTSAVFVKDMCTDCPIFIK